MLNNIIPKHIIILKYNWFLMAIICLQWNVGFRQNNILWYKLKLILRIIVLKNLYIYYNKERQYAFYINREARYCY